MKRRDVLSRNIFWWPTPQSECFVPRSDTALRPAPSFYLEYTAAGTSTHNMCHWAQHVRNGRFGFYDWGVLGNLNRCVPTIPSSLVPLPHCRAMVDCRSDQSEPFAFRSAVWMVEAFVLAYSVRFGWHSLCIPSRLSADQMCVWPHLWADKNAVKNGPVLAHFSMSPDTALLLDWAP